MIRKIYIFILTWIGRIFTFITNNIIYFGKDIWVNWYEAMNAGQQGFKEAFNGVLEGSTQEDQERSTLTDQELKDAWLIENQPLGQALGYPECCIQEFCENPPELMKHMKATKSDKIRFEASHINDKYTGFIPCYAHALQILDKEITLLSLIEGRDAEFLPFPLELQ